MFNMFKSCFYVPSVDGHWSVWTDWGGCDVTCANGTRMRSRTCTDPSPAHGGLNCSGSNTENTKCVLGPCPGMLGSC